MASPNTEYTALDQAFAHFNAALFGSALVGVLITLHKHTRARGYYRRKAFAHRGAAERFTDEICLCPNTHCGRSDQDILSTLVHEMVHLWQFHHGNPSRHGYHNREWADRMQALGLMPSSTGAPGGQRTGQRMTHYVIAGGRFDVACRELLATGWRLQWEEPETPPELVRATRQRFVCPTCRLIAYSQPSAWLICGGCLSVMR